MATGNNSFKLTPEEYQRIKQLPAIHILVGNEIKTGKYDEERGYFIMLSSDKNRKSQFVAMDKTRIDEAKAAYEKAYGGSASDAAPVDDPADEKKDDEEDENLFRAIVKRFSNKKDDEKSEKNHDDRKKKVLFIAVASVFVMIIFAYSITVINRTFRSLGSKYEQEKSQVKTEQGIEEAHEESGASAPAIELIEVIQVQRAMVAGDRIQAEDLAVAEVSAEFYNQSTLDRETQFYQGNRMDDLVGQYVTDYVQKGQYLSFGKVSSAYIVPQNPWMSEAESVYLLVPLAGAEGKEQEKIMFGTVANLEVVRTTVVEKPTELPEDDATIAGMIQHEAVQQSVIRNTYKLENVVICDLLDANKQSIWDTYASWMNIPSGEQMGYVKEIFVSDPERLEALTPVYVKLQFTQEQAAVLGQLTDKTVEVKLKLTGESDIQNEKKAETLPVVQSLKIMIEELSRQLQEDANGR